MIQCVQMKVQEYEGKLIKNMSQEAQRYVDSFLLKPQNNQKSKCKPGHPQQLAQAQRTVKKTNH